MVSRWRLRLARLKAQHVERRLVEVALQSLKLVLRDHADSGPRGDMYASRGRYESPGNETDQCALPGAILDGLVAQVFAVPGGVA